MFDAVKPTPIQLLIGKPKPITKTIGKTALALVVGYAAYRIWGR